jgi:glyoxylase-like metal-dependent hydrolase (beta-lactamase superfamily II)
MKLYPVNAGYFKLDGGAMFGVVPKSIWSKTNPADENNMCNWAMRCLLVQEGNRLILIDNGMGDKQSPKFFSHYYLNGGDTLEKSLRSHGFQADDITDVFLTHLHFDHCGGGVRWNADHTRLETVFKNATYWSNGRHWLWATQPNNREKASFLSENILPMQDSGQLQMVEEAGADGLPFQIVYANGHTDAMMLPHIHYKGRMVVFVADLLPSTGHIPLPYVMGYDTRPLKTLEEKEIFLQTAADNEYVLFLEHDPVNECCTVVRTEKGIRLKATFALADLK